MTQPRNAKKKSDKEKKKDKEKKQEQQVEEKLLDNEEPVHMRFNSMPSNILETRETSAFAQSKNAGSGIESFKDSDRFDHVNKRSFGSKSDFEGVIEVAEEYDNVPDFSGSAMKRSTGNNETPTSSFAGEHKKGKKVIKKHSKLKSKQGESDGACCSGNQCNIF